MGRTGMIGRRALLAAGAATLAACSAPAEEAAPKPLSAAERAARAELALRRRAVATSTALRDRYDAALTAHPALKARLTPLRTSAAAHAKALAEGLPEAGGAQRATGGSAGRVTAAPSGTPSATPAAAVPADPAAAVRELAALARRTADAHGAALLDAPPEYARLLASVAAAAATHAYLLTAPDAPARSTR
ncbi:hypothetical protein ABZO31_24660 [Streptomyces sp. HUAS MG47]|uniref:hypothetical protein n=1 Tax=Streptomyces solicamelliae TaxID=3231716 RepID=UPI003877EF17